jgi:hypothetical protein
MPLVGLSLVHKHIIVEEITNMLTFRRYLSLCIGLALFVLLLFSFQNIQAAEIIVGSQVPAQPTNWTQTLSLPAFNPLSGTLTSVQLTLTGFVSGNVGYENQDPVPATVTVRLHADITVLRPDNTTLYLVLPDASYTKTNVPIYDTVDDFGGASGEQRVLSDMTTAVTLFTDPADLALFMGAGNVDLTAVAVGTSSASGPGNVLLKVEAQAAGLIATVKYEYVKTAIHLEKTVYLGHNDGASCPGVEYVEDIPNSPVTYCFEITNTGETYLNNIVLNDVDLNIDIGDLTLISGSTPLAPGAKLLYFYQGSMTAPLLNTAETEGNPTDQEGNDIPNLPNPRDDDTAEVDIIPPAALGDFVWLDEDVDGVQDAAEKGMNGVVVMLLDGNGQPTGKSTTTQNHPDSGQPGYYTFTGLRPGSYQVEVANPDIFKYAFTSRNRDDQQPNPDERDSDVDILTGRTPVVTLNAGETNRTLDAGLVDPNSTTGLDEQEEPLRSQTGHPLFLPFVVSS